MLLLLAILTSWVLFTDVIYTCEGFHGVECWILHSCSYLKYLNHEVQYAV